MKTQTEQQSRITTINLLRNKAIELTTKEQYKAIVNSVISDNEFIDSLEFYRRVYNKAVTQ
jgi:hypothetical protein